MPHPSNSSHSSAIKIGISLGDPLGIGPEVTFKAIQELHEHGYHFVLYGESALFELFDFEKYTQTFVNLPQLAKNGSWDSNLCGKACIGYLESAVQDAKNGVTAALVTAPISKENIQKAGYAWPGHTEFLADRTQTKQVVMMMAAPNFKVSLVTVHIPLKKAPEHLTIDKIVATTRITFEALKRDFGISNPKIAVCGLNPHAGENGILGHEEIEIIRPAIQQLKGQGYEVFGPAVPDAVFYQMRLGLFDAVVCLYHDQGLIPFKMLHFKDGVNVTLGLPIIRCSPDHGVAYDIAGKNLADPSSMVEAIKLAAQIAKRRRV